MGREKSARTSCLVTTSFFGSGCRTGRRLTHRGWRSSYAMSLAGCSAGRSETSASSGGTGTARTQTCASTFSACRSSKGGSSSTFLSPTAREPVAITASRRQRSSRSSHTARRTDSFSSRETGRWSKRRRPSRSTRAERNAHRARGGRSGRAIASCPKHEVRTLPLAHADSRIWASPDGQLLAARDEVASALQPRFRRLGLGAENGVTGSSHDPLDDAVAYRRHPVGHQSQALVEEPFVRPHVTEHSIQACSQLPSIPPAHAREDLKDDDAAGSRYAKELLDVANDRPPARHVLEDLQGDYEVERLGLEHAEIAPRADEEDAVGPIGVDVLGQSHHAGRHVDSVALVELGRECARQPADAATEVERTGSAMRISETLRSFEQATDISFAGCEKLLELPAPSLLLGVAEDRPEGVERGEVIPLLLLAP